MIKILTSDENTSTALDQLKTIPTVKNLHVLGGEPFLWQSLPALVDHYIAEDLAGSMCLDFHTNGSIFPESLLDKIKAHYQGVEIFISIDNIGAKFELERGGDWQQIYLNLKRFSAARCDKIKIKLAVTINIQNVLDLDNLIDLSHELDLDNIVWWYLESPSHLCIDRATQTLKDLVIAKYSAHECEELRGIASRMTKTSVVSGQKFLDHMDLLDGRRGQNFSTTHRTIYEAMGGRNSDRNIII